MTNKITNIFIYISFIFILASCGYIEGKPGEDLGKDIGDKNREKHGSIFDEGGLFEGAKISVGGTSVGGKPAGGGIGVNAHLWYATLDILSFIPLRQVDPFGGVILSDWYILPNKRDERIKIDANIIGKELRSNAIRVSLFRQTLDDNNQWVNGEVKKDSAIKIENSILEKARQLRIKDELNPDNN